MNQKNSPKNMCLNYRTQSGSRIHPGLSENWILNHEKATFEMTVSLISTGDKENKVFTSSLQELRRRNCQRMIKVNSDKQLRSFRSWRVRLLGFQQQQWQQGWNDRVNLLVGTAVHPLLVKIKSRGHNCNIKLINI